MSDPLAGELGREQLRELISILGELRNAGPRDQRFKQWRQITVTLLQRMWAGEPQRAERFRRIPFSAPIMRADRKATREYFERGCSEASNYLESLALELASGMAPGSPSPVKPHADAASVRPQAEAASGEHPPPFPPHSPPPAPSGAPAHGRPEAERLSPAPRPRLKDMLGFGLKATLGHLTPTQPTPPPPAGSIPTPVAPASSGPPAATPGTIPGVTGPPSAPPAEPALGHALHGSNPDTRRDLAAEFVLESAVLQSKARPLPRTEPPPAHATPATSEVLALAARLEQLGVPLRHRAIVRAALIDLGRQMESPPVYWDSIRQAVGLAMDHPDLARRVLPLLLPYLDQAA